MLGRRGEWCVRVTRRVGVPGHAIGCSVCCGSGHGQSFSHCRAHDTCLHGCMLEQHRTDDGSEARAHYVRGALAVCGRPFECRAKPCGPACNMWRVSVCAGENLSYWGEARDSLAVPCKRRTRDDARATRLSVCHMDTARRETACELGGEGWLRVGRYHG